MSHQYTVATVNYGEFLVSALRYKFEFAGYRVRVYKTAADALELIKEPADVALLDKLSPPLDGVELYRRLREHRVGMRVIFLSAWDDIPDELRRKALPPADDYIRIPMFLEDILERVRAVVERGREERQTGG